VLFVGLIRSAGKFVRLCRLLKTVCKQSNLGYDEMRIQSLSSWVSVGSKPRREHRIKKSRTRTVACCQVHQVAETCNAGVLGMRTHYSVYHAAKTMWNSGLPKPVRIRRPEISEVLK
jgi:hypothetical protein